MNALDPLVALQQTRRQFFGRAAGGLGIAAFSSLLNPNLFAKSGDPPESPGKLPKLHFAAKAKRVIYLHQSGAPSHIDMFDYKPAMEAHHGKELPASIRMGQRITGMTS